MFLNKKNAFSIVEALTVLGILSALVLMTISNAKHNIPDMDKATFKKAYLTIEQTASNMLGDLYSSNSGFKDTSKKTTEFGEVFEGNTKFRDAFKYHQTIIEDNINCKRYPTGQGNCFKVDSGIVFGIPETTFENSLIPITIQRINGNISKNYLPITVYINWDKAKDSENQLNDYAIPVGVSVDGNVKLIPIDGCADKDKRLKCQAREYLKSGNLRK